MIALGSGKMTSIGIRKQKRADLVTEELKQLITQHNLKPGDKLLQEIKPQETFGVSKDTIHEVFKSLEAQGLVSVNTRPAGGGTIVEVLSDRTFQLMQNYLFFKDIGITDVYTVRHPPEPELVAGTTPYLTEDDFRAFEYVINLCDPASTKAVTSSDQRQEDLNFHDTLAAANPNLMLRFYCELINEMIRQLVMFGNEASLKDHAKFGTSNVKLHRQILSTARACDADTVRTLMSTHMDNCIHHVMCMKGRMYSRLVLGSEMSRRHRPLIDDHDDSGRNDHGEDRV